VLVKRGDIAVTAADFYAYVAQFPESQRSFFRGDLEKIKNAVSSMYVNRSLAADAVAQGLDKDPEFQHRMALTRESVLASIYLERFNKAITPPDFTAVALEKYKAAQERYTVVASVRLRQLMVGIQGRTDEEAQKRMAEVRSRLVGGELFNGAIVREYSNDPRARFTDGVFDGPYTNLPPEVAAVAKTIALSQLSEPIKTKDGYWIIRVDERLPSHVTPFDDVKDDLVASEEKKYRGAAIDRKLGSITNSKEVVVYTDEIAALQIQVDRKLLDQMHIDRGRKDAEEKKRLIEEASKRPAN
jgi:parvulin-like peptidyl-prolyl isomerase